MKLEKSKKTYLNVAKALLIKLGRNKAGYVFYCAEPAY
jgi:hypothetical protein